MTIESRKANPLLFSDPSPALRWRAAVELDGADEDDGEVEHWRAELERADDLADLLNQLRRSEDNPMAAGYLLCQLTYRGYRGPGLNAAAERVFAQQLPDGSWPLSTPGAQPRRGAVPALPPSESYRMITTTTTLPLRGLAAAGFATDPRAERAYEWLIDQRLFDGSWTGSHKADLGTDGRSSGEDPSYRKLAPGEGCRSATTGAVACFALHPERRTSEVARIGMRHLLAQNTNHAGSIGWEVARLVGLEKGRGVFTFYVETDPAFLLDLASRCEISPDEANLSGVVDFVRSRQGTYGLWEHQAHPQLSRWLTFDIECSLRRLQPSS